MDGHAPPNLFGIAVGQDPLPRQHASTEPIPMSEMLLLVSGSVQTHSNCLFAVCGTEATDGTDATCA